MSSSPAAEFARGVEIDLSIERLADSGKSIASLPDGRVVFLRGGAPGDVVRARLTRVKKRFAEGTILKHLSTGPETIAPFCKLHETCGGCPWQTAPRAMQAEALQRHVERMLTRAAGAPVDLKWQPTDDTIAWRSTARLHWQDRKIGYHRPQSKEVVDVASCPVLAAPLPAMLAAVRTHFPLTGTGSLRLTARVGAESGTIWIQPRQQPTKAHRKAAKSLMISDSVHGVVLDGQRMGHPIDRLGPLEVPHPTGSFVQAHQPGNAMLVKAAVAACGPPGEVLELFAGAGNFTFALTQAGHSVRAIEIDATAARSLKAEAERRDAKVEAEAGDATKLIESSKGSLPKVALIDPPRAGAPEAIKSLHEAGVERLVYVACDPATLARDVGWLVAQGWSLESAQAFDLFPHTGHVESLCVLVRAAA